MVQLELNQLCKDYHERRVLFRVSTTLRAEVVALLGPNGAGKSTLLGILSTQIRPSEGEVRLNGVPMWSDVEKTRGLIGMLGHQGFLYRAMTIQENLEFYGRLYRVESLAQRIDFLSERLGLHARLDQPVSELSRGWLQRTALARALLHDPQVLLLDEPFTGLDTLGVHELREWMGLWKKQGKLVIVATHQLELASQCCQRFLLLRRGRLRHDIPEAQTTQQLLALFEETPRKGKR